MKDNLYTKQDKELNEIGISLFEAIGNYKKKNDLKPLKDNVYTALFSYFPIIHPSKIFKKSKTSRVTTLFLEPFSGITLSTKSYGTFDFLLVSKLRNAGNDDHFKIRQ